MGISLEGQQPVNLNLFPHITCVFDHAYWNTSLTKNMNDRIFLEMFFSHFWTCKLLESVWFLLYGLLKFWCAWYYQSIQNVCVCMYICIHTHMYTHTCVYVFVTGKVDMTRYRVFFVVVSILGICVFSVIPHFLCNSYNQTTVHLFIMIKIANSCDFHKCVSAVESVRSKLTRGDDFICTVTCHHLIRSTVMDIGVNDLS